MPENVTIVGGGLAGLSLGIGLRRQGVPVTLWEAGTYPRHRVCGEFISGNGQACLDRLGLLQGLPAERTHLARNAAFFAGPDRVVEHSLPEAALCISRFELDHWLAGQFQQLGGQLREGERWREKFPAGIVRATGRRAEPVAGGWRLFGLKVHARGVSLEADLEMHFIPSGYVGLCKLAEGEVNICGLFRCKTAVPDLAQRWADWLRGPVKSSLHARLAEAEFDESSFSTVAGLCLRPRCATQDNECSIGDALTMIPPVTGNGMSMAFESAELAIGPLVKFSHGQCTWEQARSEIALRCEERFASRLRCAAWLQSALFHPPARSVLMSVIAHSDWCWRKLFDGTR